MTNAELATELRRVLDVAEYVCKHRDAILAALESDWTPVTESLPPEYVRVQVWFEDERADHAMLRYGYWVNYNWHRDLPASASCITHWRHITPPTTAKENR